MCHFCIAIKRGEESERKREGEVHFISSVVLLIFPRNEKKRSCFYSFIERRSSRLVRRSEAITWGLLDASLLKVRMYIQMHAHKRIVFHRETKNKTEKEEKW